MIKRIEPLKDPKFIHPVKIIYDRDGEELSWEAVKAHDSVAVLLYHSKKEAFVLVKQFRPALYMQHGYPYSFELCAGIVDKKKSLEEIAKEEIIEETGYQAQSLEKITSFYTSVGFAGSKQTLFYAEVEQKVSEGGGIEDEKIEVVYLPLNEAKAFMYDESKPKTPGLLFAFCWWFEQHKEY
ncbi:MULTISPECIES: NUDIX domain-containing protein [unclassified Nitratiruptor]|uniref:NUDIX domain-containing protein n=1 Tax=unclassified Nitratiruptor TaxID=2624044 RepID=UPI001914DF99|nr:MULTISPECIES: NUDIX domain-containing protein [unclassified Nitratiruptor]BCD59677.1 UDP-sugar diphosphatase [Nitratiruptor sp. YY08-10]BCD63601.1 UDP-sugar diphosphatase [Nitratiruptor sp. YY08-14]